MIIEYRKNLSLMKVSENNRYLQENNKWNLFQNFCRFTILLPFAILGILHAGIPYILVKKLVEKRFKRDVFWASVKLILVFFMQSQELGSKNTLYMRLNPLPQMIQVLATPSVMIHWVILA